MGLKLIWTGLTFIMVASLVYPLLEPVGQILMGIGLILMWLDK